MKDKRIEQLEELLAREKFGSQEEIAVRMQEVYKIEISQSTVHRLLKRERIVADEETGYYTLPRETAVRKAKEFLTEVTLKEMRQGYICYFLVKPAYGALARLRWRELNWSEVFAVTVDEDLVTVICHSETDAKKALAHIQPEKKDQESPSR